jgi:hypothetical protein
MVGITKSPSSSAKFLQTSAFRTSATGGFRFHVCICIAPLREPRSLIYACFWFGILFIPLCLCRACLRRFRVYVGSETLRGVWCGLMVVVCRDTYSAVQMQFIDGLTLLECDMAPFCCLLLKPMCWSDRLDPVTFVVWSLGAASSRFQESCLRVS